MKRKILSGVLLGTMLIAVLAGCSGQSSGGSGSVEAGADAAGTTTGNQGEAAADGPVSITVMCGYAGEDPHGQYIYQYADAFMAEHPEVKIEVQAISTNDIYTKLAAMATTPGDVPTVFFTSADAVATLYDLGLTQDLNAFLSQETKDGFANGVVDACILDDKMVYYPVAVQPQAVIYRKDRFAAAGLKIPVTWDEFVDCAKVLTVDNDQDGETDEWGFSMVGSNNSSGQSRFMSYLWSNGFEMVYQEAGSGEWQTDISADPAFVGVFTKWTDMNTEGIVPTGITEVDYPTSANYFAMGYTSMFLTGPNALGVTYASNPDLKGKLASFKVPGDYPGTMLGVEGYAVSSHATDAQKQAAVDFLTFFTGHDKEMQFWQSSGKIPTTLAGQQADYLAGEDYAGFLQQIEDGCRPTMAFAGVSGLKSALGNAYASVFSEEKDGQEAVEGLVKAVDELLEDYN